MQAAIKHLHAFVSEVQPSGAEWFKAIQFLTAIGHKCDDKRQEFILASDVMGVSMLIDDINNRRVAGATPSTVEGPFHIPDAPEVADGGDMAKGAPGIPCFVTGTVRGLNGEPVAGAVLDLWQTDGEGLYEEQRRTVEPWMRGIYRSKADGSYSIRTVAPISYTIPMDGPIGEFFGHTNMSHMRPAHIHFAISAPGYHGVVTHLFQKGDEHIDSDVVYGVKAPLVVEFVKRPPGKAPNGEMVDTPFYQVKYDFVLEQQQQAALAAAE
jgi:hydroxyquinol 1,2-dioxygenase